MDEKALNFWAYYSSMKPHNILLGFFQEAKDHKSQYEKEAWNEERKQLQDRLQEKEELIESMPHKVRQYIDCSL